MVPEFFSSGQFGALGCLLRLGSPIPCSKGDGLGEGVGVERFYRYEVFE